MRICVIENCNKKHEARKFCKNHYKSFIKYGDPLAVEIRKQERKEQKYEEDKKKKPPKKIYSTNGTCKIDGCNDNIKAKKMCEKHYARQLRKGTTELSTIERGSIQNCLALDCKRPHKSNGYCSTHAKCFTDTGSPYMPKVIKLCGVNDCYEKHWGRGMCKKHFYELKKIIRKNGLHKQTFERGEKMNELVFIHNDLECRECMTNEGGFAINYYEGTLDKREIQKYVCTNEDCNYEEIVFIDELEIDNKGNVTKIKNTDNDVGQKITMDNGQTRILRKDKNGLYVKLGGLKNYVYYMDSYGKYAMTGKWDHME